MANHSKTPEEYQAELLRLYQLARAAAPPTESVKKPPVPQAAPTDAPAVSAMQGETDAPPKVPPAAPTLPTEENLPTESAEPPAVQTPKSTPPSPNISEEMSMETPAPEQHPLDHTANESQTPAVEMPPVLSHPSEPEMTSEATPAPAQPNIPEKERSIGWIQVITRTANNALPLPGVTVLITNGSGRNMRLEYTAITNASGETEKIPLPAPPLAFSLDSDETAIPYSTYDVSVYADGYYRQISEKVPVFPGTTSRQIFSMIPLPSDLLEPPQPIIYQNTEPNL